jgi:F420-0:gamma-glutamyl ligase-like protein
MAIKRESGGGVKLPKIPAKKLTPAQKKAAQVNKAIKAVQKRTGVTAREARDIVTEISTIAKYNTTLAYRGTSNSMKKEAASNRQAYGRSSDRLIKDHPLGFGKPNPAANAGAKSLKKQIKEVVTAARTGKQGTTAARTSNYKGAMTEWQSVGNDQRKPLKKPVGPKGR